MLISIQGTIIDTEDIYKISEVSGDNCWSTSDKIKHSGFHFYIELFNDKSISVSLDGDSFGYCWWETDYENRINQIEQKVKDFRETVIGYWNKSKSQIPQIEFPKD
jgi:hypothetical protein